VLLNLTRASVKYKLAKNVHERSASKIYFSKIDVNRDIDAYRIAGIDLKGLAFQFGGTGKFLLSNG
jgi:hypothetical protein